MAFLEEIDPRRVISFHQPLHGVDTDTKDAGFARRLARALRLPRTSLDCGGLCHGTMTMWFNHRFRGSALTVEYGGRPSRHRMVVQAPRQLLGVIGAHRSAPRLSLSGRGSATVEGRLLLGHERVDRGEVVLGAAGERHLVGLEGQRLLQRVRGGVRHCLPDRAERDRRARRQPRGELADGLRRARPR